MGLYNVDFPALVVQLMPVRLRKAKHVRWLQCLVAPVITLYKSFTANRNNDLYVLAHNSQVVYLQAALNDTFDPVTRGIYITDGGFEDPLFVYLDAEHEPLPLYLNTESHPDWLYMNAETALEGYAFIVKVPTAITYNEAHMRALIDKYRLPSKNYYAIHTI